MGMQRRRAAGCAMGRAARQVGSIRSWRPSLTAALLFISTTCAGRAADLQGAKIEVPMIVNGEPQYQLVLQVGTAGRAGQILAQRCAAAFDSCASGSVSVTASTC